MKRFLPSSLKALTVLVTVVAWLAISNHCALAATLLFNQQKTCEHCEKPDDSQKSAPHSVVDCCKGVKAVTDGKVDWQPLTALIGLTDYALSDGGLCALPSVILCSAMPTGPPEAVSFAEFDLQRCHLVNAPPFLG